MENDQQLFEALNKIVGALKGLDSKSQVKVLRAAIMLNELEELIFKKGDDE